MQREQGKGNQVPLLTKQTRGCVAEAKQCISSYEAICPNRSIDGVKSRAPVAETEDLHPMATSFQARFLASRELCGCRQNGEGMCTFEARRSRHDIGPVVPWGLSLVVCSPLLQVLLLI